MSAWVDQVVFWHWWVLAVALLVVEILVPSTFLLWPALAAVLVGLALLALPELGWEAQLLGFAVASVLATLAGRAYLRRHPIASDRPRLNRRGEQYIGRTFTLSEPVTNGVGRIRVDDTQWRIEGTDLPAGTQVRVVGVDGTSLRVEPTGPAG